MLRNRDGFAAGMLVAALATAVATILAPGPCRAADDTCVSTRVEAPLRLPDGSLHPAGKLTLCHTRQFSPIASLHKTYVDGVPIGVMLSRKGESEVPGEGDPVILFHRDARGSLTLIGYVISKRRASVTYVFGEPGRNMRRGSREHRDLVAARHRQPSSELVALAAPSQ